MAGCGRFATATSTWPRAQSTPAAAPRSATTRATGGRCARRSTSRRASTGISPCGTSARCPAPTCPPTRRSTRAWRWRFDARLELALLLENLFDRAPRRMGPGGEPGRVSRARSSVQLRLAGSMSLRALAATALIALAASLRRAAARCAQATAPSLEASVKAAFLYKFLGFVEWPPAAFARADSPLVIGVARRRCRCMPSCSRLCRAARRKAGRSQRASSPRATRSTACTCCSSAGAYTDAPRVAAVAAQPAGAGRERSADGAVSRAARSTSCSSTAACASRPRCRRPSARARLSSRLLAVAERVVSQIAVTTLR